jgi:hypothetical protein
MSGWHGQTHVDRTGCTSSFGDLLEKAGLDDVTPQIVYDAWHACFYGPGDLFGALWTVLDKSNTAVCHYLEVVEVPITIRGMGRFATLHFAVSLVYVFNAQTRSHFTCASTSIFVCIRVALSVCVYVCVCDVGCVMCG